MWLDHVQRSIGIPRDAWTVKEWKQAAETLGSVADALAGLLREAVEAQRPAAPKKRGRKPKQRFASLAEAVLGISRAGIGRGKVGRPRRWSDAQERELLKCFVSWKANRAQWQGKKLTDREAADALWLEIYKEKGFPPRQAKGMALAFSKDMSDLRQKYGRPLRRKSKNSR